MAELAGEAADGGASVLVGRCEEVTVPYQPLALALEASTEVTQTLERQPAGLKSRLAPLLWSERPHAAEEQSPSQAERVALWRSTCALLGALLPIGRCSWSSTTRTASTRPPHCC